MIASVDRSKFSSEMIWNRKGNALKIYGKIWELNISYIATCQKSINYNTIWELRSSGLVVVITCRRFAFRYNLSTQSPRTDNLQWSRIQASWLLKPGQISCPETSVRNYRTHCAISPVKCSSHLLHSRILKSRTVQFGCYIKCIFGYSNLFAQGHSFRRMRPLSLRRIATKVSVECSCIQNVIWHQFDDSVETPAHVSSHMTAIHILPSCLFERRFSIILPRKLFSTPPPQGCIALRFSHQNTARVSARHCVKYAPPISSSFALSP